MTTRPLPIVLLLLSLAATASADWTQLNGPDPAVATCLAAHDGVLFVGSHESDAGDVFRSTDGGLTWRNAHQPNHGANAMLSHASGIYVGRYIDGLVRSRDDGLTWQQVTGGLPAAFDVETLATTGNTLFVGGLHLGSSNIYRSSDAGDTWSPLATAPSAIPLCLLAAGNTVLVGTERGGLHRSSNLGANWAPGAGVPAGASVTALGRDGAAFYAGVNVVTDPTANGIYRSVDDGVSWLKVSVDAPGSPLLAVRAIGVHDGVLLAALTGAAAHGVYRSDDGGVHWAEISATLPVDDAALSLLTTEDDLLVGFQNGVYRTADLGATWTFAGQGTAAIRTTGSLLVAGDRLLVGKQAAGGGGMGICFTDDAGAAWTTANGVATNASAEALAEMDGVLYAALYAGYRGVARSFDDGASWQNASAGLPANLIMRDLLAQDGVLLAATWTGLFRSTNGADTWSQMPGVPNVQSLGPFAGALYAGLGDGGVLRSTDGGLTWSPLSTGLPAGNGVTSFATLGGALFAGVWQGGVYRLDGAAWTRVGLANGFIEDLIAVDGALLAAELYSGISVTTDGTQWSSLFDGFTDEYVSRFAADDAYVYAGTNGHGIWALPLSELPGGLTAVPIADANATLRVSPNPFNPQTTVRFDLPAPGAARLQVVDLRGRVVRTIVDGVLPAGPHALIWDGCDDAGRAVASGVYVARLAAAGSATSSRIALVR